MSLRPLILLAVLLLAQALPLSAHDTRGKGSLTGTWKGSWGNAWEKGTLEVVINDEGSVQGTLTNTTRKIEGTIKGTVDNSGKVPAEFVFEYQYGEKTFTGKGPVLLDGEGRLIGITDLFVLSKAQLGTIAVNLTREPHEK